MTLISQQEPDWRASLRRFGIRPDKRLGQHFLFDSRILEAVVASAELEPGTRVLEIGAGLGSLTWHLAAAGLRVTAVEVDRRLAQALEEAVGGLEQVDLVFADALSLRLGSLFSDSLYAVVANIPYNITSSLVRKLLEADRAPFRLALTIQAEVAQRIVEAPGEMSLLSLSVQVYGIPRIAAHIPAGAFFPRPAVDSSVLRIDVHPQPKVSGQQVGRFFALARAGFSQRRKKLANSLSAGLRVPPAHVRSWMQEAGLSADARAQELSVEDWLQLVSTPGPMGAEG